MTYNDLIRIRDFNYWRARQPLPAGWWKPGFTVRFVLDSYDMKLQVYGVKTFDPTLVTAAMQRAAKRLRT